MEPSQLGDIYSMNPGAFWQAQGQIGQQDVRQAADLATVLEANKQSQAMNPLKLQQQRLQNQTTEAQLPGVVGLSQKQGVEGRISVDTEQEQKRAKLQQLTKDMSDADLEMTQNAIKQKALTGDPNAIQAMELFEDVIREKAKQKYMADRQMELERLRGSNQIAAIREGNQGKLAVKNAGAKSSPTDFWSTFYGKLKNARDRHAALVLEAQKIEADNPEEAGKMRAMAESIRPQAEAEIASAKPGTVDVSGATGGSVPTLPGPTIAPKTPEQERKPIGMSKGKPVFAGDVLVKDGKKFVVQPDGTLKAQ